MQLVLNPYAIVRSSGRERAVPAKTLKSYTGQYVMQDNPQHQVLSLQWQDGHLIATNQNQKSVILRAESPNRFYAVEQSLEAEFTPDASGTFSMALFDYQNSTRTLWWRSASK